MLNYSQALAYVIKPALDSLGLAIFEPLLIGTLAKESLGGTYLSHPNGGSGLGFWQMEPTTHDEIWRIYLPNQPELASKLMTLCDMSRIPKPVVLRTNLLYAACMCAIYYKWRLEQNKRATPTSIEECAKVWKLCYNPTKGKLEDWVKAYNDYVGIKAVKSAAK